MAASPLSSVPPGRQFCGRGMHAALLLALLSGCVAVRPPWRSSRDLLAARELTLQAVGAMRHGDWDTAQRALAEAVEKCPADEEVRRYYSQVLWQQGRRSEAVAHLEHALSLASTPDPATVVQLGQMYADIGQLAAAQRQADRAVQMDVDSAPAWRLMGRIQHQLDKRDEALRAYQRALSLDPEDSATRLRVAAIYLEWNRPGRALGTLSPLQSAADMPYEAGVLWELRGRALLASGRADEAVVALEQATAYAHPSAGLLAELAAAYRQAGREDEAERTGQLAQRMLAPGERRVSPTVQDSQPAPLAPIASRPARR